MIHPEPADIYSYDILDSDEEQQFSDLVDLASLICNCPISTITFIDPKKSRQWFKARKNMADKETPLDVSFCAHAVAENNLLLVEDATKSKIFSNFANVTGGLKIRFYAGSPVRTTSGKGLGTLCVIDTKPRKLTEEQLEALRKLSDQASRLLELRLLSKHLKRKSDKLLASAESYKDFFDNSPFAQWIYDTNTFKFLAVNKAAQELYGYTEQEFLQLSLFDVISYTSREMVPINEAIKEHGKIQLVTDHKRKDGKKIAVEASVSIILYAGHEVSIATMIDLSEKLRLQEELMNEKRDVTRKVATAMLNAQTQERKNLAMELHDNINQMLASTSLLLNVASSDDEMRLDLIIRSQEYLLTTIKEVRRLSHTLAEEKTKGMNLEDAIRDLLAPYYMAKTPQIAYSSSGNINGLPEEMKKTLLRIIQESFQNIAKYAQATTIEMKLVIDHVVHLVIKDNGKGFDTTQDTEGIGTKNIRERTEQLNGRAYIVSSPGSGCIVDVTIPLII